MSTIPYTQLLENFTGGEAKGSKWNNSGGRSRSASLAAIAAANADSDYGSHALPGGFKVVPFNQLKGMEPDTEYVMVIDDESIAPLYFQLVEPPTNLRKVKIQVSRPNPDYGKAGKVRTIDLSTDDSGPGGFTIGVATGRMPRNARKRK